MIIGPKRPYLALILFYYPAIINQLNALTNKTALIVKSEEVFK